MVETGPYLGGEVVVRGWIVVVMLVAAVATAING
jgi:hypothetical protein